MADFAYCALCVFAAICACACIFSSTFIIAFGWFIFTQIAALSLIGLHYSQVLALLEFQLLTASSLLLLAVSLFLGNAHAKSQTRWLKMLGGTFAATLLLIAPILSTSIQRDDHIEPLGHFSDLFSGDLIVYLGIVLVLTMANIFCSAVFLKKEG